MADEIVFLLDSKIYFKGSINNLKNKTKLRSGNCKNFNERKCLKYYDTVFLILYVIDGVMYIFSFI